MRVIASFRIGPTIQAMACCAPSITPQALDCSVAQLPGLRRSVRETAFELNESAAGESGAIRGVRLALETHSLLIEPVQHPRHSRLLLNITEQAVQIISDVRSEIFSVNTNIYHSR